MNAATVSEIKRELKGKSEADLLDLCLRLSRFKKENKELMTYLLFEASDESAFIQGVKDEIDVMFLEININSYFYIKKSVRKILRMIKKHVRYSKKKQTEVELLLHFCSVLKSMSPSMKNDSVLFNIFKKQIELARKALSTLHPDLQYDYEEEINKLY